MADRREFRIYYFLDHEKLIYLNSVVKKTAQTPDNVKNKSVALIQKYLDEMRE